MPTLLAPPIGTTTNGQASLRSLVETSYEPHTFDGLTYTVPPRDDGEEEPRARLAALVELAREAERDQPYYPDSPEQVQDRAETIAALYEAQLEAIAAREDRDQ